MRRILISLTALFTMLSYTYAEDLSSVEGYVRDLSSKNSEARNRGRDKLRDVRNNVVESCLKILRAEWGQSYHSPAHLAVEQLGEWRSRESIPLLVKNIDWEIPKETLPVGKKYPAWITYPCAMALNEIGGREVRLAILRTVEVGKSDKTLKLMAWVLHQTEGPAVAIMFLGAQKKSAKTPGEAELFERLVEYVEQGDAVFVNF